ncbi:DegT/DnrJ/EryC1/StrS family aminotransferase [Arenimonas composti]|uniref:DegT/DnrJ/EryC1/StrS aminotransferase family protein n=1 Tax=Arenimonas composti TR7-09 = DSM 18010 TaxID=1121013 RepID=A0A091BEY2_9GAMM|nr:DegT/DnrJ/EryC1/StrS family aminotransferase [Arenimonas composti]KFN51263.1 hypothetical protein P873_03080 [Arenimonas composti TR7-09 = DSM 18010]
MIPRYRSPLGIGELIASFRQRHSPGPRGDFAGLPDHPPAWFASASDALCSWLRRNGTTGHIVVPAYTCIRIVEAIETAGWTPHFVDIDHETLAVDGTAVRAILDRVPVPKAILATHLHGLPSPLADLRRLADHGNASLVEDCAMAQGALAADGSPVGAVGDASIFSFGLGKVCSFGAGGALVPAEREREADAPRAVWRAMLVWASRVGVVGDLRYAAQEALKGILRGNRPVQGAGDYAPAGWSVDAGHMLARFLAAPHRAAELEARRLRSADWHAFVAALGSARVGVPRIGPAVRPCFPHLPLLVAERDELADRLRAVGVHTARYFDYVAAELAGADGDFPGARSVSSRILLLPMDPGIDASAAAVRAALAAHASTG